MSRRPTDHAPDNPVPHKRRPRYKGRNPRDFHLKYKELAGDTNILEKVRSAGKTPAGTHRPIMLAEIMEILQPSPGQSFIDCTLGFGGHSEEILQKIMPGGRLIALDTDKAELERTARRLFDLYGNSSFLPFHTNYAGLSKLLSDHVPEGADGILADLGLSSMQIDDPDRGFSYKTNGPLDMRMNQGVGPTARELIHKTPPGKIEKWLHQYSDEPRAAVIARQLAGNDYASTLDLAHAIRECTPDWDHKKTLARVFQAFRIAVNDEFSALESLLRIIPSSLKPGGRVAILTFHSGEDRRIKHFFRNGLAQGIWEKTNREVLRPSSRETHDNPRASSAKLRWAVKAAE